jgi:hypothetical protein
VPRLAFDLFARAIGLQLDICDGLLQAADHLFDHADDSLSLFTLSGALPTVGEPVSCGVQ